MKASPSMMQEMFRNMQFPMTKDQIIEHATRQNISSDIIENLQMIPDREYESADSLMKAMEAASQQAGRGGGGKSQSFGGTGVGETGEGDPSSGGSSQGFGGRGGE
ncbi:DUF2795 domain-containing protein [Methanosarcina sp. UBA5]|uniref:DUF2795 domain-containing protein n=1 Tax=Methanosarcina sp. UBA5 TaxID=1915593 RepID=UPI0025CF71EB|nr:DUF2795 domain-containing protein [Methanosarcina sp. UBA5]